MIPDWQVNTAFLPNLLQARHPSVLASLLKILSTHGIEVRQLSEVRDIWARDYSPIHVSHRQLVQFRYEPDYLADNPELRTDRTVADQFREFGEIEHSEINLDGGNVVGSVNSAILTDKIYRENPAWAKVKLRNELRRLLQVDQLIISPKEPYDPIGHVDAMVRFVDEQTVLMNDYSRIDPKFGERLLKLLQRHSFQIELLPYYQEKRSKDGIPSAVGCFLNFLRTEQVLVLPIFGSKYDKVAQKKLESVFPDLPIIPLHCTDLARDGGILNCVTAGFRRFQDSV